VCNYLLRLGWGHGDEEIVSRERAIELFDLAGVGRSPSRFDLKKLENLNGHYIREADDARLAALVAPRVAALMGRDLSADDTALLARAMPGLKPRAKTLHEIADGSLFLFAQRPLVPDDKAMALLDANGIDLLVASAKALEPLRHPQALCADGHVHLRPGLHLDRQLRSGHHLHRRRRGRAAATAATRSSSWPSSRDFLEVCYLLLNGELPNAGPEEADNSKPRSPPHDGARADAPSSRGFRRDAHPMASCAAWSARCRPSITTRTDINDPSSANIAAIRLIAKMPTIAAMAYKYSVGQPFRVPRRTTCPTPATSCA
jgi:hypothetical protein